MISGILLGLAVFAFLVVLAVAGDQQALGLVVVIVVGVALIYFGGRHARIARPGLRSAVAWPVTTSAAGCTDCAAAARLP